MEERSLLLYAALGFGSSQACQTDARAHMDRVLLQRTSFTLLLEDLQKAIAQHRKAWKDAQEAKLDSAHRQKGGDHLHHSWLMCMDYQFEVWKSLRGLRHSLGLLFVCIVALHVRLELRTSPPLSDPRGVSELCLLIPHLLEAKGVGSSSMGLVNYLWQLLPYHTASHATADHIEDVFVPARKILCLIQHCILLFPFANKCSFLLDQLPLSPACLNFPYFVTPYLPPPPPPLSSVTDTNKDKPSTTTEKPEKTLSLRPSPNLLPSSTFATSPLSSPSASPALTPAVSPSSTTSSVSSPPSSPFATLASPPPSPLPSPLPSPVLRSRSLILKTSTDVVEELAVPSNYSPFTIHLPKTPAPAPLKPGEDAGDYVAGGGNLLRGVFPSPFKAASAPTQGGGMGRFPRGPRPITFHEDVLCLPQSVQERMHILHQCVPAPRPPGPISDSDSPVAVLYRSMLPHFNHYVQALMKVLLGTVQLLSLPKKAADPEPINKPKFGTSKFGSTKARGGRGGSGQWGGKKLSLKGTGGGGPSPRILSSQADLRPEIVCSEDFKNTLLGRVAAEPGQFQPPEKMSHGFVRHAVVESSSQLLAGCLVESALFSILSLLKMFRYYHELAGWWWVGHLHKKNTVVVLVKLLRVILPLIDSPTGEPELFYIGLGHLVRVLNKLTKHSVCHAALLPKLGAQVVLRGIIQHVHKIPESNRSYAMNLMRLFSLKVMKTMWKFLPHSFRQVNMLIVNGIYHTCRLDIGNSWMTTLDPEPVIPMYYAHHLKHFQALQYKCFQFSQALEPSLKDGPPIPYTTSTNTNTPRDADLELLEEYGLFLNSLADFPELALITALDNDASSLPELNRMESLELTERGAEAYFQSLPRVQPNEVKSERFSSSALSLEELLPEF